MRLISHQYLKPMKTDGYDVRKAQLHKDFKTNYTTPKRQLLISNNLCFH